MNTNLQDNRGSRGEKDLVMKFKIFPREATKTFPAKKRKVKKIPKVIDEKRVPEG